MSGLDGSSTKQSVACSEGGGPETGRGFAAVGSRPAMGTRQFLLIFGSQVACFLLTFPSYYDYTA